MRKGRNRQRNSSKSGDANKEIRGGAANIDRAMQGVDKPKREKPRPGQPKKDSKSKRINEDNARVSKVLKDIKEGMLDDDANDISWYSNNPELLKSAASIPFGSILGKTISNLTSQRVPGVFVIDWQPAYGANEIILNQCWNSRYSFVVHANSRNYKYNAPDLGILCMGGTEVFNIIGTMMWAFGVFRYYEAERNYYYPKAILEARGFDFVDLRDHSSQMWFDINNLVNQTKQIWFPNDMPIFDRWFWMNTTYFTDAVGTTSQTYLYNQDTFYVYDEQTFQTGGALVAIAGDGKPFLDPEKQQLFNPCSAHVYTWEEWKLVAQSMIDALIASEDRGIIYGDILNAYGADRIRALAPIESNYLIAPTYNAEVLAQFENATVSNCFLHGYGQVNNNIVTVWSNSPLEIDNHDDGTMDGYDKDETILNFHFPEQPSPELVTIATRAKSWGLYTNAAGNRFIPVNNEISVASNVLQLRHFASEIHHAMHYLKLERNISGLTQYKAIRVDGLLYPSENTVGLDTITYLGDIMAFDWHPFIYVAENSAKRPVKTQSGMQGCPGYQAVYGDFDNYTAMSGTNIDRINDMVMFSLLGVPTLI